MRTITTTIRWLLLALLIVTPWFFGGVWARVQWVLMLSTAILMALDLVTRFSDEDRPNLVPSAWLPLLFGVALGLFQLVAWPPGMAKTFAAGAVQWREELTATPTASSGQNGPNANAQPDAVNESDTASSTDELPTATLPFEQIEPAWRQLDVGGRISRTLYAVATREHLALLTLGMAVFVLASMHLVDRQSTVWFFAAVGTCGAALSFFGLVQRLTWNGKFYWLFEPSYGGFQSFGPFVNRNNAGGFLNLCLAAAIGLLVWIHWNHAEDASSPKSSRRRRVPRRPGAGDTDLSARATRIPPMPPSGSRTNETGHEALLDSNATAAVPEMAAAEEFEQPADGESGDGDELNESDDADDFASAESMRRPQGTDPDNDLSLLDAYQQSRRERDEEQRPQPEHAEPTPRRRERRRVRTRISMAANPTSYGAAGSTLPTSTANTVMATITNYLSSLNATRASVLAMVALTAGGVLSTASRGSIMAMFAAVMVTVITLSVRRGSYGYAGGLIVMLLAGVGLMSWSGQAEFVRSRFEEMFNEEAIYEHGRVPNWSEALRTWPQFPLAGTGLGTYRFVYERYQQRFLGDIVHTHAENQFIQAIVEGGLIALLLVLVEIGLTVAAITKLFRTGGPVNTSLAVVGTFGLTSQVVGGLFDFGLYIPSNTLLMAALCGMVIGRAALLSVWPADALRELDRKRKGSEYKPSSSESSSGSSSRSKSGRRRSSRSTSLTDDRHTVPGESRTQRESSVRRLQTGPTASPLVGIGAPSNLVTLVVGFLFLGCLFGSLELNKAGRIESALLQAPGNEPLAWADPDRLRLSVAPLATALPIRWDDAEAHQRLAEYQIAQYQAHTYQQLKASRIATIEGNASESSGPDPSDVVDPELWARSSIVQLHATLRGMDRAEKRTEAAELRTSETVREFLVPAVRHLLIARHNAPTIGRVHYLLAELSAVFPELGSELAHLQRAQLLTPGNASLWYWSGIMDLSGLRKDAACAAWRKSLILSPIHLNDIMTNAQGQLTGRQLLEDTLPFQADLLLRVSQKYFAGEERAKFRQVFLRKAEEAIPKTDLPPAELAYVTASILNLSGRGADAVPFYVDAIARKGTELNWRYEFARLLVDLRDYDKAHEQATYLARVNPQSVAYKKLLEEVIGKRLRRGLEEIE